MEWMSLAASSVLDQRRYATTIAVHAEVALADDLGLLADTPGMALRNRVQLGRRFAIDPGLRIDWPSKSPYGAAWGAGTSLDLRFYAKSLGPVHLVGVVGAAVDGGKRVQALDAQAKTETLAGFFEAELRGGGAVEWTPSQQLALALEVTTAPVQGGRWWVEGEALARPEAKNAVTAGLELAWWWR